jgi:pimeloyl-ACP methyl ester carboxylesterase
VQLNHHRAGSGDPVLLIHGVGSQWQVWEPVIEPLARGRDVIAIDLPGHGGSQTLPVGVEPGASALADAVASFLDSIGVERAVIGGNSLGGWTALELAKRDRAKAVVALSPAGFFSDWEAEWCRAHLSTNVKLIRRWPERFSSFTRRPGLRQLTMGGIVGRPAEMPAAAAVGIQRGALAATAFDATIATLTSQRFEGTVPIDVPVTLVWGTRDLVLFPWQARRAFEQIPHARHLPLQGAGHVPTWDDPDAIVRELLTVG